MSDCTVPDVCFWLIKPGAVIKIFLTLHVFQIKIRILSCIFEGNCTCFWTLRNTGSYWWNFRFNLKAIFFFSFFTHFFSFLTATTSRNVRIFGKLIKQNSLWKTACQELEFPAKMRPTAGLEYPFSIFIKVFLIFVRFFYCLWNVLKCRFFVCFFVLFVC